MINKGKVVLIGAGMVGAATLNALLMQNLFSDVAVIDLDRDRAEGEVLDARHTTAFTYSANANIHAGDYEECKDAAIIVMTAGPSIQAGEMDRQLLAQKNVDVMTKVMGEVTRYTKEAVLITVTNPVDVVTYCAQQRFDYPIQRVIGTGTLLDTARMRQIIARQCDVDSKNVHGYVFGEHGKAAFIPWSLVDIAGVPVDQLQHVLQLPTAIDKDEVLRQTKDVAFEIVQKKGYTNSGIAMSVCRLARAIVLNERCVLPVSTVLQGTYGIRDVALSVPNIITRDGVRCALEIPLQPSDRQALHESAQTLSRTLRSVGL